VVTAHACVIECRRLTTPDARKSESTVTDDSDDVRAGTGIDSSIPHSARIWNYWLGGKDNYPVDREAGDAWAATQPHIVPIARAGRAFLGRAVTYLAREVGIRQFLDVGTGLPTASNTHEVAQTAAPASRVVYVDNDPLVLAHARALLSSAPEGETLYLDADMHDSDHLITEASKVLDFTQPVAVIFMGVLGHITDLAEARALVRRLLDRVPSGSYLALCDGTLPEDPEIRAATEKAQQDYADTGAVPYWNRDRSDVRGFFDGLDLIDPGFVSISLWRPEIATAGLATIGEPQELDYYGGVARKP
jgi:SAM-dependent methyltransferase